MKKVLLFTVIFYCTIASLTAQTTYTHVECGTEFTLALRSDSTLWTWGYNANGQLGNATYTLSDTPIRVLPSQKCIYAATGAVHAMAIAADSTLWGWGLNGNGQLGTGSYSTNAAPTKVSAVKHWRYVSAGEAHTVAILNDGTLWATGDNSYGQLGTGDTSSHTSFVQIGTASNWKTVAAGGVFTLAIKQDGTLWAWGYNGDGELGTGSTTDTFHSPTQIGSGANWVMVSGGFEFSLAMKSDGTIWSTGFNGNGQLGVSTATGNDSLFTQVGTATDWKYIAAGSSFGFAIKQNGTLWGWGYNATGQLGVSSTSSSEPITQAGTDTDWHYISAADGASTTSGVFGLHAAGYKNRADGICTAGADYEGQLGNGITISLPGGQNYFGCSVGLLPSSVPGIVNNLHNITPYPNPAHNILYVDGLQTSVSYRIINMMGAVVQDGRLQPGDNNISLQTLLPGAYILDINNKDGERCKLAIVKE